MAAPHPGWKPREPEWAQLAPGVEWLIRPLTGDVQAKVQARTARAIASLQEGRALLEDLGFEDDLGALADLNTLAGLSVYCAAVYYAEALVADWRGDGMRDVQTGELVDVSPETIRIAMKVGAPDGGSALMEPFMAWIERPRVPIAADVRRLRALAKWEHGGAAEHCAGCELVEAGCARGGRDEEGGERCPRAVNAPQTVPGMAAWKVSQAAGVWRRAGMGGQVVGLDYAAALAMVDVAEQAGDAFAERGAFVRCLKAIEAGALEAMAERSKSN